MDQDKKMKYVKHRHVVVAAGIKITRKVILIRKLFSNVPSNAKEPKLIMSPAIAPFATGTWKRLPKYINNIIHKKSSYL